MVSGAAQVRTIVVITLGTLVSMFITLFLHQYRQWEINLREKVTQPVLI
jgi:hypothetical protein